MPANTLALWTKWITTAVRVRSAGALRPTVRMPIRCPIPRFRAVLGKRVHEARRAFDGDVIILVNIPATALTDQFLIFNISGLIDD